MSETYAYLLPSAFSGGGNPEHPVVQLEIREFEESIKVQKNRSWWDWRELVHTRNARWRIAMVTLMSYGSQLSGNSVRRDAEDEVPDYSDDRIGTDILSPEHVHSAWHHLY